MKYIWNDSYLYCGFWMKVMNDHRSKFFNLSSWKEKPEKNQGFNGIRTHDLRDTGAMLYQLSYEATHWERGQLIEFMSSREEWNDVKYIWNDSYLYCGFWMKVMNDHRSKFSNLSSWKEKPEKKIRASTAHGKKWTQLIDLAPNLIFFRLLNRAKINFGEQLISLKRSKYFVFVLDTLK